MALADNLWSNPVGRELFLTKWGACFSVVYQVSGTSNPKSVAKAVKQSLCAKRRVVGSVDFKYHHFKGGRLIRSSEAGADTVVFCQELPAGMRQYTQKYVAWCEKGVLNNVYFGLVNPSLQEWQGIARCGGNFSMQMVEILFENGKWGNQF